MATIVGRTAECCLRNRKDRYLFIALGVEVGSSAWFESGQKHRVLTMGRRPEHVSPARIRQVRGIRNANLQKAMSYMTSADLGSPRGLVRC